MHSRFLTPSDPPPGTDTIICHRIYFPRRGSIDYLECWLLHRVQGGPWHSVLIGCWGRQGLRPLMMPTGRRLCLAQKVSLGPEQSMAPAQGLRKGLGWPEGTPTASGTLTGPALWARVVGRVSSVVYRLGLAEHLKDLPVGF